MVDRAEGKPHRDRSGLTISSRELSRSPSLAAPLAPAEPFLPIPNPDFGEGRLDGLDVGEELEDDVDPFGHGFDLNTQE